MRLGGVGNTPAAVLWGRRILRTSQRGTEGFTVLQKQKPEVRKNRKGQPVYHLRTQCGVFVWLVFSLFSVWKIPLAARKPLYPPAATAPARGLFTTSAAPGSWFLSPAFTVLVCRSSWKSRFSAGSTGWRLITGQFKCKSETSENISGNEKLEHSEIVALSEDLYNESNEGDSTTLTITKKWLTTGNPKAEVVLRSLFKIWTLLWKRCKSPQP